MGPWATANYCRAGIKSLRGTLGLSGMVSTVPGYLPVQYGTFLRVCVKPYKLLLQSLLYKLGWTGKSFSLYPTARILHCHLFTTTCTVPVLHGRIIQITNCIQADRRLQSGDISHQYGKQSLFVICSSLRRPIFLFFVLFS